MGGTKSTKPRGIARAGAKLVEAVAVRGRSKLRIVTGGSLGAAN